MCALAPASALQDGHGGADRGFEHLGFDDNAFSALETDFENMLTELSSDAIRSLAHITCMHSYSRAPYWRTSEKCSTSYSIVADCGSKETTYGLWRTVFTLGMLPWTYTLHIRNASFARRARVGTEVRARCRLTPWPFWAAAPCSFGAERAGMRPQGLRERHTAHQHSCPSTAILPNPHQGR